MHYDRMVETALRGVLREALTVGVGMCGRAEIAFILAALALTQGAIDQTTFTSLILVAFVLNLLPRWH